MAAGGGAHRMALWVAASQAADCVGLHRGQPQLASPADTLPLATVLPRIVPPRPTRPLLQEKRALFDSVAPYSTSTALTPGPSPGGAMSPYAPRPLPGAGAAPSPAYRGTPLGALGVGRSPLAAGNLALRGRAAKYAEVVRRLNAGGQGNSPVQEFAAACADESNGAGVGGNVRQAGGDAHVTMSCECSVGSGTEPPGSCQDGVACPSPSHKPAFWARHPPLPCRRAAHHHAARVAGAVPPAERRGWAARGGARAAHRGAAGGGAALPGGQLHGAHAEGGGHAPHAGGGARAAWARSNGQCSLPAGWQRGTASCGTDRQMGWVGGEPRGGCSA